MTESHFEEPPSQDDAQQWLAQFAPLVMEEEALTLDAVRRRLATIDTLRETTPAASQSFSEVDATVQRAVSQLDSIESDLRKQLAKLAPGDPRGLTDIDSLNEKLAERAARTELNASPLELDATLRLKTGSGSWATAVFPFLFGLGWTSFTMFHSVLMIGGMWKAFGPIALFMLLFYSIFYAVGFSMLWAAFRKLASESIELAGDRLTIRRQVGPVRIERQFTIKMDVPAVISSTVAAFMPQKEGIKTPLIQLTDVNGKTIAFGENLSEGERTTTLDKLNGYLTQNR